MPIVKKPQLPSIRVLNRIDFFLPGLIGLAGNFPQILVTLGPPPPAI